MKDKIICILFVIFLTFLFVSPVKADTVGEPFGTDVSNFDSSLTLSNGVRWVISFSDTYTDYDHFGYAGENVNFLIMKCGNYLYVITPLDKSVYFDLDHRFKGGGFPEYYEWYQKSPLFSDSHFNVFSSFNVASGGWSNVSYQYDYEFATYDEMIAYLQSNYSDLLDGDGNIVLPEDGDNEENVTLPAMQYNVSRKWAPRPLTNILAYNAWVEWDYMLYELYKNNPADYKVQLYVQKGFSYKPDSGSEILAQGEMKHILDRNIVDNVMTFSLDKTGNDLYGDEWYVSVTHNNPNFYYAYVRISSLDEKSHSKWQCFQCSKSSISNIGEVDIGDKDSLGFTHITKNSDGDVNLDDSAFHKDPNGDKTTASTDPSSALYDGNSLSFDNIVSNIKSVVASVNAVADLLTSVYGWFPQWLINLIVAGIGAVVVVGLFKLIK